MGSDCISSMIEMMDMNGDGMLNIIDVVMLVDKILHES